MEYQHRKILNFIKMNNNNNNIYVYILLLSIIFYLFNNLNEKILLIIIIILILSYFLYLKHNNNIINDKNNIENKEKKLNENLNNLKSINNNNNLTLINNLPKKFKFLIKDNILLETIDNISFVKKFSKSRYTEILVNTDKLVKVYIYILSDIYNPIQYISIFNDLKYNILEILYSIIYIIPIKFKYIYGIDPISTLNKSIEKFIFRTRKMSTILEKYSKYEKNIIYIEDSLIQSYNKIENKKNILP